MWLMFGDYKCLIRHYLMSMRTKNVLKTRYFLKKLNHHLKIYKHCLKNYFQTPKFV